MASSTIETKNGLIWFKIRNGSNTPSFNGITLSSFFPDATQDKYALVSGHGRIKVPSLSSSFKQITVKPTITNGVDVSGSSEIWFAPDDTNIDVTNKPCTEIYIDVFALPINKAEVRTN